MMQKMAVLSSFYVFYDYVNYEYPIIVESIIELTVYVSDGLIFGLCASEYGFVCM